MNERIKEIAEQSGMVDDKFGMFFAKEKHCEDGVDLQKFAELIVRECLSKIENEAAQYAEPVWAFELVNDIKEHFGIGHD